jgi:hypothetical protein
MEKPKKPAKVLEHLRVMKGADPTGGTVVEHHFTSYEHPSEQHPFTEPSESVELPKGHPLQHIAEHMGIPHSIIEEKEESPNKSNTKADEPDEEEELES